MKYICTLIISIFLLTFFVPSAFAAGLEFTDFEIEVDGEVDDDVDVNGGSFETAPGDVIVLTVEVENTYPTTSTTHEIRNIDVQLDLDSFCPENLDEDIREEIRLDDLEPGVDDSATFRFTIPDCADEDNFDIDIRVEGKDDADDTEYIIEKTLVLTVQKDPSAVTLELSRPSPQTIDCKDRTFSVTVEAHNIGSIDLDSGLLIIQDDLGINKFKFLDLRTGRWTEENTHYEETFTFPVPEDVDAGTYDLRAEIEYEDGDREEKRFQEVIVPFCETSEPVEETISNNDSFEDQEESDADLETDAVIQETSENSPSAIVSSSEIVQEEQEVSSENKFMTLPVLIIALLVGLLVLFVMLSALLRKN